MSFSLAHPSLFALPLVQQLLPKGPHLPAGRLGPGGPWPSLSCSPGESWDVWGRCLHPNQSPPPNAGAPCEVAEGGEGPALGCTHGSRALSSWAAQVLGVL